MYPHLDGKTLPRVISFKSKHNLFTIVCEIKNCLRIVKPYAFFEPFVLKPYDNCSVWRCSMAKSFVSILMHDKSRLQQSTDSVSILKSRIFF